MERDGLGSSSLERCFEYSVMDVFAEHALEGNPLAVFHDARGMSDAEMQRVAREMNLSETTFVLPEEDESAGVRVRIFTVQEELPFAGHPTLGTAAWLHLNRLRGQRRIVLRENLGAIVVAFEGIDGEGVVGMMQQNDPVFGDAFEIAEVAAVIGMAAEDFLPEVKPQSVSTGMSFCIVALRSVEALARLAMPAKESSAWLKERGLRWFYCIAPSQRDAREAVWRARMQFYGGEDPATGSAAGCCVAYMVQHGLLESEQMLVLEQGVEMLRPSRIVARAKKMQGNVCDVRVSGRTIPVAEGRLFLPEAK
jgi:trans-2,3-dihydro-3-hydroxyanthranilate isomerase